MSVTAMMKLPFDLTKMEILLASYLMSYHLMTLRVTYFLGPFPRKGNLVLVVLRSKVMDLILQE